MVEQDKVSRSRKTWPVYHGEDFFHTLPHEKGEFINVSIHRKLKKYEYAFIEGDPATTGFYLAEGILKTSRVNKDGKEIILYIHKTGDLFGITGSMYGKPRIASAQALSPCELYEININNFWSLLVKYPSLMEMVIVWLVRRVSFLTDRYLSSVYDSAGSRLRMFLAYIYYEELINMKANKAVKSSALNINQQMLASIVGVSRQTVNQLLHNLDRDKIIKIHRNKIIFLDPNFLLDALEI